MHRFLFFCFIVSSINSFAQLQSSEEICNSLKKIATADWEYGEYHLEELGKISWTKSMSDWTDSDIESLKDITLSCRSANKWSVDSVYLTDLTNRNITTLKAKLPVWKSKHAGNSAIKSTLDEIKKQIDIPESKIKLSDESIYLSAKQKLESLSISPEDSNTMIRIQLLGSIADRLQIIKSKKMTIEAEKEEAKFKQDQIDDENKTKEVLLKIQKSDPKKFQACEKQKQKMVSLVERLAKGKESVDQAVSQRKQAEVLKEMEKIAYEVDQLKDKIESNGCSKFYKAN